MQVGKLTGQDLVYWFLQAAGEPLRFEHSPGEVDFFHSESLPELSWALVGPVMHRENISLTWYDLDQCWAAFDRYGDYEMQDADALVAVARCCIRTIFGLDVPEGKSQPMDMHP